MGADVCLEASAEMVTPDRFCNRLPRGRDPQSAARQLALYVGHDLARRADDEPYQLADRPYFAADRAHAPGRGLFSPRSIVELGVGQSEHAVMRLLISNVQCHGGVLAASMVQEKSGQAGCPSDSSSASTSASGLAISASLIQP